MTDNLWFPIVASARVVNFSMKNTVVNSRQHSKHDVQHTTAVIKLPGIRLIARVNESE